MIIMYPCLYSVSAPLEAIALLLEQNSQLINQQARGVKIRSRESLKDFGRSQEIYLQIYHSSVGQYNSRNELLKHVSPW